ncbi:MAG: epoxyqueuosine reductase QueH [Treponema sp.]|nr:epoxyqueuosine reductase QueH [Treponema sp.]
MKVNYQKLLDEVINALSQESPQKKPSLLLHACCGPCSSYVLEYLAGFFQITVFYYNPNIYPPEEYQRRLEELKNLYKRFPPALENSVRIVEAPYIPEDFFTAIKVREEPELAREAEKGERCRRCYALRLENSFSYALENHFDYFCTTLSISPFKDAEKINIIGENLVKEFCSSHPESETFPKWLYSDFKKRGGFKRSLELSAEYNLYRQQYCGCVYSLQNTQPHEPSST